MRPLADCDPRGVLGVLTDVDDTLTTAGRLEAPAYAMLWRLQQAGLPVIPVTGRSAGWAHLMLRTWPVAAVVAESGGLFLRRDPLDGRLVERLHAPPAQIDADRRQLAAVADRVMAAVPGLRPATDQSYRRVDLALDHAEEVGPLAPAEVDRAVAMFVAEGCRARASSIHVNAWIGDFDKAPTALRCLAETFAGSPLADPGRWAFIGDAPNDASMFATFAQTVGVANILRVRDRLPRAPAYVTRAAEGAGFVEFGEHLLAARAG